MFYTYVIKSLTHNFYCKGHCENPEERLKRLHSGRTFSTKPLLTKIPIPESRLLVIQPVNRWRISTPAFVDGSSPAEELVLFNLVIVNHWLRFFYFS